MWPTFRRKIRSPQGFETDPARRASAIAVLVNVLFALFALLIASLVLLSLDRHHTVVSLIERKIEVWYELEKLIKYDLTKLENKNALRRLGNKLVDKVSDKIAERDSLHQTLKTALQQDVWWMLATTIGLSPQPPNIDEVTVSDNIIDNIRNFTDFSIEYAVVELESWDSADQILFLSGGYLQPLRSISNEVKKFISYSDNTITLVLVLTGAFMLVTAVLTRSVLIIPALDALDERHRRELEFAKDLRDSEKLTSEAFKALPTPALVCDSHGNIKYFNKSFETHILSTTPQQINNLFSLLSFWQQNFGWATNASLTSALEVLAAIENHEVVNADGNLLKIRCVATSANDILVLVTDETANFAARNKENHRKRLESLGRFSSGVAHDFNNILATILAKTEYLMMTDLPKNEVNQHLNDLVVSCDRGRSLVSRIVAYTRPQSPNLEICGANELTDLLCSQLNSPPPHIHLNINSDTNLGALLDPLMITTAIENLVKNAYESIGSANHGNVYIDFVQEPNSDGQIEFVISVRDTGNGFDEGALSNALEPFYSTKALEAGVGLGLSMASQLVETNGGNIELTNWNAPLLSTARNHSKKPEIKTSKEFAYEIACEFAGELTADIADEQFKRKKPEQGARVILSFPAVELAHRNRQPGNNDNSLLHSEKQQPIKKSGSCIILEDDTLLLKTQEMILSEHFDNVVVASSNVEFHNLIRKHKPFEAAVLDWNLPDGTSEQTINLVKDHSPECKIVILTGNVSLELQHLSEGLDISIVRKPITMAKVVEILT